MGAGPPRRPPEDELVLLLAGTRARRDVLEPRARAALRQADPHRLARRLEELRVLEAVGPRVLALGADAHLARRVARARDLARTKGQADLVVARAACRLLERRGIPAVPIKGPDLALRVHGDAGARRSGDVDLLVAPEQLAAAVDALGELGYRRAFPERPWQPEYHHALVHAAPAMPPIEVHRRVEGYAGDALTRGVLARSGLADTGLRELVPADELALLLLVFARDGLHGVRFPVDLAAWWDRYGAALPDGALRGIVDRHPAAALPLATAATVASRVVGLPAAALLDPTPADGLRARTARRLARTTEPRRRTHTAFADALLTAPSALPGLAARVALRPRRLDRVRRPAMAPPDAQAGESGKNIADAATGASPSQTSSMTGAS